MGGQVRKGEKGTLCCYFDVVAKRSAPGSDDTMSDEETRTHYPMCKPFWVFNVAQVDGLPVVLDTTSARQPFEAIAAADQLIVATGAVIRHGFDHAGCSPARDEIVLPDLTQFYSPADYYATTLHELTHWTGHACRLNRTFGKRFGDAAYAFEELVAELGSAFLASRLEFSEGLIIDHANYIGSWIQVLKQDKTAIFTASKHACQAYDFLLGKEALSV